MESNRHSKYETFYNIRLSQFYHFITDVMRDFNYSLHHSISEMDGKRRIEIWNLASNDEQKALVWIEVLKPDNPLDPYLTTDVLRAMNDNDVTRLFFFTNGEMSEDDRSVLEGNNHFIFSTEEIVETLLAIETKQSIKVVKTRKTVKTPSAMVLIKNYFKTSDIKKKQIKLKLSATPELVGQYSQLIKKIIEDIDKIEDMNDVPAVKRDKLKKIQYSLLPELAKVPNYFFQREFGYLRNTLFNLIQVTTIYIGNIVEYEAEEDLVKNRQIIDELLLSLDDVQLKVDSFNADMVYMAERSAMKIIITSGILIFVLLVLFIMVKFGN